VPYFVWLALAVPAAFILLLYTTGCTGYGQSIYLTGQVSVACLLTALAITPLRRLLGGFRWINALSSHRRALGISSFAYASLHTIIYLERKWGSGLIVSELGNLDIFVGWLALFMMLPLAITSNDLSVRRLASRWSALHRLVYAATLLTFVHWILATVEPLVPYLCLGGFLLLQLARLRRSTTR